MENDIEKLVPLLLAGETENAWELSATFLEQGLSVSSYYEGLKCFEDNPTTPPGLMEFLIQHGMQTEHLIDNFQELRKRFTVSSQKKKLFTKSIWMKLLQY